MKDIALKVPRWLLVTTACLSAGGVFFVTAMSKSLSGIPLVVFIVVGVVFAATAIAIPQFQQWQTSQKSRIKVSIDPLVPDAGITRLIDSKSVIESMARREVVKLLDSMRHTLASPTPGELRSGTRVRKISDFKARGKGLTVREAERLLAKRASGEEMTAGELEKLAEADEALTSLRETISSAFSFGYSVEPEERSPEAFRQEVAIYYSGLLEAAQNHLIWEFVEHSLGSVHFTLKNDTEKVFENVAVTLTIRGANAGVESDFRKPDPVPPRRPRPYGPYRVKRLSSFDLLASPHKYAGVPKSLFIQDADVLIEVGETCEVSFSPITLRPDSSVTLDPLVLFVTDPEVREIEVQWTATATNVDGKESGSQSISISNRSAPVDEYLKDFIERVLSIPKE
ncbi:hypothetical protein [Amycolatopsis sp. WAC 01416]|uniref:hypothetical protein n=1 Tax=Amycolatopsis sp. WAC 01416 TaxID=2203196 RepID=UPI000F7909AA|nr:hypothetical protein [Amycolatopsis sp. WAC 01416]